MGNTVRTVHFNVPKRNWNQEPTELNRHQESPELSWDEESPELSWDEEPPQRNRNQEPPELDINQELKRTQDPPESTQRFSIEYAELVRGTLLGYGRYGRVHRHEHNGTTVAVKDIAISAKEQPRLERLLREGKILTELRHRNIITLFDSHLLHQHLLLVMEFAAGGSLSDVLKKHTRLEPIVVTNWARQISNGMHYLHEKHIVHRDLKSSNILVLEPIDNSGLLGKTMKIADFGLACDGHDETRTMSEFGGTEFWVAPEVLEPPHHFSKASDVYSFGVVVWNLLTGNKPTRDLAKKLQDQKNLPLIPPFYNGLLTKCCTSVHLERPTFREIISDITQWRRDATEPEGIALRKEELGGVLVNVHASPSRAPALSLKQPSLQQQAPSSPPPSQQQQQQQQSVSFADASDSFKLPDYCRDVALTQDGRSLLLAAEQHGLIELSLAGCFQSRWQPPKHSSGRDYEVCAVATLSDRRAAVSLYLAELIVLLRRNERSSSSTGGAAAAVAATTVGGDTWTEDRRIQLPWSAAFLSAHGDVLAMSELGGRGERLQLLNLSSSRLLSKTELQRDYEISSLAVTARLLVTGSLFKMQLGGGHLAQVLDAHRLDADDERLWRYMLTSSSSSNQQEEEDEEELCGVCADSSGGCLYIAVRSSNWTSSRVSALNLADGSELHRLALRFHSAAAAAAPDRLLRPMRLSLCDVGAAEQLRSSGSSRRSDGRALLLAALFGSLVAGKKRKVTLHRSTSDKLK